MKLYSAKIRLKGSLLHEVWMYQVTAAELQLLVRIHGGGDNFPLAEVIETGSVARPDRKERARLHLKYIDWGLGQGDKLIREVLGGDGVALPQMYAPPISDEIEDFNFDEPEKTEEAEEIEALATPVSVIAPKRTRVPRGGLSAENVPQHEHAEAE